MERKRIIYLVLLVALALVLSSCHPRHVSDIKPNMTKEQVASLWGKTPLVTTRAVGGKSVETWEYNFSNSDSVCWVTFSQDRVTSTQCRPMRGGATWYEAQRGQSKAGPPPGDQNLVREGAFAMELAAVLKLGEAKNEAEAENKLTSAGIAPKKGWIADYPMTPEIMEQLRIAVSEAADAGAIALKPDEAAKAFQDLVTSMESQYAGVEPPPAGQPYPEPYYYPRYYAYPAPYPYPYPYPYSFGGYYRFSFPYRDHWR